MLDFNIELKNTTILVTGSAGFVGSNLVMELLRTVPDIHIVGFDNMNDYYDVSIKEYRLSEIEKLAAEHPSEKVGAEIRKLYSWSDEDKLINN